MNKKLFLPIFLILLIGFVVFISAQEPSFSISINKGWNLIPTITPESVVSGSPIQWSEFKYAYVYVPHKKDYIMIVGPEDKIDSFDNSTTINQREAEQVLRSSMWVYSETEGSLVIRVDEDVAEKYFYPPEFELDSGWNFLWVTPYIIDKSLNDIKGNCNIEKAFGWWSESKNGQGWDSHGLNTKFHQITTGRGFVIKVTGECTLGDESSETSSIQPPTLPINQCVDGDNGKNYEERSSVTVGLNTYQDICEKNAIIDLQDSKRLKEYYCDEESFNTIMYDCSNGCENGACVI